jgi:hypothetical protein
MKSLFFVLGSVLTLVACGNAQDTNAVSKLAADTSGCSPLLRRSYEVTTVQNFVLRASFEMPNRPQCWNADRSQVVLSYRFTQEGNNSADTNVGFWIRADGREEFLKARVNCFPMASGAQFSCTAEAFLSRWIQNLEVAPVRNGVWDTAGIGQNYGFRL